MMKKLCLLLACLLTLSKFDFDTTVDFKEGSNSEFDALFSHHEWTAPQESKEVEIVFDRPFYFVLTDKYGEVLFDGKVMGL